MSLTYLFKNIKKNNLLAVHTANKSCIESKKKNIINNETDAPSGKHNACIVSNVANLPKSKLELFSKIIIKIIV